MSHSQMNRSFDLNLNSNSAATSPGDMRKMMLLIWEMKI